MCGNGLDFERASERASGVEWSGVKWNGQSVSQSVVKSVHQSKAKLLFFSCVKKKKKTKKEYIYPPLYTPCTTYLTVQEIFY